MQAKRIVTVLPPLSFEEALECTKIHSISGLLPANAALVTTRPFRSLGESSALPPCLSINSQVACLHQEVGECSIEKLIGVLTSDCELGHIGERL